MPPRGWRIRIKDFVIHEYFGISDGLYGILFRTTCPL